MRGCRVGGGGGVSDAAGGGRAAVGRAESGDAETAGQVLPLGWIDR